MVTATITTNNLIMDYRDEQYTIISSLELPQSKKVSTRFITSINESLAFAGIKLTGYYTDANGIVNFVVNNYMFDILEEDQKRILLNLVVALRNNDHEWFLISKLAYYLRKPITYTANYRRSVLRNMRKFVEENKGASDSTNDVALVAWPYVGKLLIKDLSPQDIMQVDMLTRMSSVSTIYKLMLAADTGRES